MSDVGYTDTPYGRCPIKSIRTLATPLITPLVQEFRHLSSSASCFRELRSSFFPFPFRSLDSGDGIRIVGERELDCQGGRSVNGGGAVHSRWFLDRLAAPDVTFRPQDGIGGWGDPWTGYYSWLFVAQFAGPTMDNEWKTAVCVAGRRMCNARGC